MKFRFPSKFPAKARRRRGAERGFTLIEIMVVVIIIGMLASLVGVYVFDQVVQARQDTARTQIKNFESALDLYRLDCHRYPDTEMGLKALIPPGPAGGAGCKRYKQMGYLAGGKIPADPWDNEYAYQSPGPGGEPYWLASYGRDGVAGGEGEDMDITTNDGIEQTGK